MPPLHWQGKVSMSSSSRPRNFPGKLVLTARSRREENESFPTDTTLEKVSFLQYVITSGILALKKKLPTMDSFERSARFAQRTPRITESVNNSLVLLSSLTSSNAKDVSVANFVVVPALMTIVDTDFVALGHNNNAWNVVSRRKFTIPIAKTVIAQVRSEFDQILLNHARESGATVHENTRVTELQFSGNDPTRPISASWVCSPSVTTPAATSAPLQTDYFSAISSPVRKCAAPLTPPPTPTIPAAPFPSQKLTGTISFTHLIDATGRAGLLSTRYLKNRYFNASLKNIAVWGYWSGTGQYGAGSVESRRGAPWFEALTGKSSLAT